MSTAIPAKEAHIIPATPAKEFNSLWIRNFAVRSYGVDNESSIYIEVCPYAPERNEIDHAHPREIRLPLWALVNTPENGGPNPAAIAMGAIFQAIPWIENYVEAQEAARLKALETVEEVVEEVQSEE